MTDEATSRQPAELERRVLRYSVLANALIAVVGVVMALVTRSQAILLDGLFNLVFVFVGLFTLRVSALLQAGDDAEFPMGHAYFEPLVNGIKGMIVLGISGLAALGAIGALFSGGRSIAAGGAVLYGVFATVVGVSMAGVLRRSALRVGSPLLRIDAQNWFLNGVISSAVLLAFLGTWFLTRSSYAGYAPYMDPIVVITLVLISISVPIRMSWQALMEMLNRAPSRATRDEVTRELSQELSQLPLENLVVRVIQPGRTRMVLAHAVLPEDFGAMDLSRMDELRRSARARLERHHAPVELDLVFTIDPDWGRFRGDPRTE